MNKFILRCICKVHVNRIIRFRKNIKHCHRLIDKANGLYVSDFSLH